MGTQDALLGRRSTSSICTPCSLSVLLLFAVVLTCCTSNIHIQPTHTVNRTLARIRPSVTTLSDRGFDSATRTHASCLHFIHLCSAHAPSSTNNASTKRPLGIGAAALPTFHPYKQQPKTIRSQSSQVVSSFRQNFGRYQIELIFRGQNPILQSISPLLPLPPLLLLLLNPPFHLLVPYPFYRLLWSCHHSTIVRFHQPNRLYYPLQLLSHLRTFLFWNPSAQVPNP